MSCAGPTRALCPDRPSTTVSGSLGQVSPAYSAVNRHAVRRLRRWLCLKHKVRTGKYVRFTGPGIRPEDAARCLQLSGRRA